MWNNKNYLILGALLLTIIFNLTDLRLQAQNGLPDSLITERLQFLKKTIDSEKTHTQRWWYGWLGLYSAATIGQGAIYFSTDSKSLRQDMVLGAATTLLGAAGQFISPLMPNKKVEQFSLMAENSSDKQLLKLARAEELIQECIILETQARNWQTHAMTSAVNIGGGLITWLGFKRSPIEGLITFAINEAVTEIQILTSPTFAKRNYKKYCRKYLNQNNSVSYTPEANWYLQSYPGGLGIRVVF